MEMVIAWSVFALVGLVGFIRSARKYRLIQDTPTSKIRSAAQGYVEFSAMVAADSSQLEGPLSGEPCVWWKYQIEKRDVVGNKRKWTTVEQRQSQELFQIDDGTGSCWVDPEGATISPLFKKVWQGSLRHPRKPDSEPKLLGFALGGNRFRYTEWRMRRLDPIYAIGFFQSDEGDRQMLQEGRLQGEIISKWKANFPDLLKRFDHDANGVLDEQEWQQVREAALQQARRQLQEIRAEPVRNLLTKHPQGLPFILSAYGERELVARLRWKALFAALLLLFSALMAINAWQ